VKAEMRELRRKISDTKLWSMWRRRFGEKAKLGSDEQLAILLFGDMGYPVTKRTDSGAPSVDESALSDITDLPVLKDIVRYSKYDKVLGTYLLGIQRETVNGILHPVFNLNTAKTFRSSSEAPNFQNMPVRDKLQGRLIRRALRPRKGHVLVENDYSGVEVRVAACYHRDPVMITYIKDTTKDMHRDMSMQIYKLSPEEWKACEAVKSAKAIRHCGKNQFVFPQFYGDYYVNNAKSMWESMAKQSLLGPDGKPLVEHLKRNGIKERGACDGGEKPKSGTFEAHMKEVEYDFWNRRFSVYGKWKKDWWNSYLTKGYFDIYSGFRVQGLLAKNDVINYPVQGAAFHCLLWALIRVNKILKKRKMRTLVVGQIHDSLIADVYIPELTDYLNIVRQVMTEDIKEQFPWLIVPLDIENEITPPGATWYDKQVVDFSQGVYTFKAADGTKSTFSDHDGFLHHIKDIRNA
jgi:DNA polymerase-1